jgi:hypothetical protein
MKESDSKESRKSEITRARDKAGQPNDVCPCGQVMLPTAMMFTA